MSLQDNAIGGYFELELPPPKTLLYPDALAFQSARAAFLALLRAGKPGRVWMPNYICGSMLTSLEQANVQAAFYHIDDGFFPAEDILLQDEDWLLYVNYFGVCASQVESVLTRFGRNRVVVDCSQALFHVPRNCLATIYSPRKFIGVPDGGLLISSIPVDAPKLIDAESFERSSPLIKRLAFSPEDGYADHRRLEKTLFGQEPRGMSDLTKRMLSTLDYEEVRRIRNRNFRFLHRHLGKHNFLQLDSDAVDGPMCYPFLTESAQLKSFLIRKRIFVATYWAEVLERAETSEHEARLVKNLVPLPCDQRYGEKEMARVVEASLRCLADSEENRMP